MKKSVRRILSAVLVLAMAVGFLPTFQLAVDASAAETGTTAVLAYVADISKYRSATEKHDVNNDNAFDISTVYSNYPAKEGYVFAGWYTNIVNMTPLGKNVTTGGAYAKFVPEALMKAVAQVSTSTDYTTASSAMRFVAAVDSLDYSQVGFLLNKEGSNKTYTHASKAVYDELSAVTKGGALDPDYFHETATHMFALTLTGIRDQSAKYKVTPFWITQDGTKVDHIPTGDKAVEMGIKANMAAGLTPQPPKADPNVETTAWYDENKTEFVLSTPGEFMGFVTLAQTNDFAGKTIRLATDIVWAEGNAADWATTAPPKHWTPIPAFAGTFDGQGHTLSGLYYKNDAGNKTYGIFATATAATIENLTIANSRLICEAGSGDNGILVGKAAGITVQNVTIAEDVTVSGATHTGIVAFAEGANPVTFKNVWLAGTVTNPMWTARFGGFLGFCSNTKNLVINLENCLFTGVVEQLHATTNAENYVGGMVGATPSDVKINFKNCLSAGTVIKTTPTNCHTGSLLGIGSWRGAAYTSFTNSYATTECYSVATSRAESTYTGTPVLMAKADLLGTIPEGMGAAWTAREGDVPVVIPDVTWIATAEDLLAFSKAQETSSFAGKTVILANDIVLNEGDAKTWATNAPANMWDPIGKGDASLAFDGTFDGNGHTISGLYYDSALYGGGLFVYTGTKATIKNLKLTNSYIRSTYGAEWSATGSVAAFVNGTDFINVYSDAIIDTNSGYTGGIIGRAQATPVNIENCEFAGTVTATTATGNFIGGLIGGFSTNTTGASVIENCKVTGIVSGANTFVGGITGVAQGAAGNTLSVKNVSVSGAITGTVGIAGGLFGRVGSSNVTVENSTFTGTVNGGTKLGGFAGQVNTAGYTTTIKNSTFDGTITATNTAESVVAGFVANVNNGSVTVENCESKGTLVAPSPYAAGVIAQVVAAGTGTITVEGCIATTDIQCASSNAGGIIARLHKDGKFTTILRNNLAKVSFSYDSWCTGQVIAHADGNKVTAENNFFVQTANSAANGVESSGSGVSRAPVKVSAKTFDYLVDCLATGMMPDYNGFVDSGLVIKDAADFFGFSIYSQTSNCSGKTVKLGANIVINEGNAADWSVNAPKYNAYPIGADVAFAGTFDGQGYTISGLYMAYPDGHSLGLFREVTGTVKNFKLTNSYLENTAEVNYGYNGTITAILNGGTISRVYTDAYITTVDSYAGGIAGYTTGAAATVSECIFDGLLLARCSLHSGCIDPASASREHAKYVGGLVGAGIATTNNIRDCIYSGKIINECKQAHRTGGIIGGVPNSGKTVTITGCMTLGAFATINHSSNSYHFNMIMDCRGEKNGNTEITTKPANLNTLFADNYVLQVYLYNAEGTRINANSPVTGASSGGVSTVRYTTMAKLLTKITEQMADGTSPLDFANTWSYKQGALPVLRWIDPDRVAIPYTLTVGEDKIFCLEMTGEQLAQYKDAKLKATLLEGQKSDSGAQLYSLAYEYPAAVAFKDIDYCENAYITKYASTTLEDYTWYIGQMKNYGFQVVASNIINTDDAYYTALTYNGHSYSVTYFANTGETYVTASNEMKFSPFMDKDYYKTADDNDPKKTTYNDITVTMVELSGGGLCQIIRLKNGHYIVIDGGTKVSYERNADGSFKTDADGNAIYYQDRRELAAALGATVDKYTAGDTNNPQVIVDAWVFTHDHADHIGWMQGGIYGAMQVDVYVKGFYYNFTDDFRVEADVKVSTDASGNPVYVPGYAMQLYGYEDSKGTNGANRYYKAEPDTSPFWVEYTAAHKMANNINTPSWGSKGIPIYRLQAGQKFYFDGVTMEVPYTQDQVMPSEYKMDVNASCAWLLFTDNHGNTYLEAGDTEIQNQDAVIALYDDYYDGGSGPNYALFGADLVNAFHHGLNTEINSDNNYTRLNTIFGIQNSNGNAATANTATNANDGRTKFIFYTRGYLNSIFGYTSDTTKWNSRNMRANHYLTGYVYPQLVTNSLNAAKNYPNLKSPIAFAAYSTKPDEKGVTWQGTTTVSFSASGISWNKQQTSSIYP